MNAIRMLVDRLPAGPALGARKERRLARPVLMVAFATLLLSACAPTLTITTESRTASAGTSQVVDIPGNTRGALEVVLADGRSFVVPPGHFPPPGACRVWYPSRPPGQQPPAGGCSERIATAPSGTVVLRR